MNSEKALTKLMAAYESRSSLRRHEFIGLVRDAGAEVRAGKGGDVVMSIEGRKVSMNGHSREEIGYRYMRPIIEALRPF